MESALTRSGDGDCWDERGRGTERKRERGKRPYCAAERWALAAALSRFGTLSGVRLIRSSPTDAYAITPTLSFARSSYASTRLAFVPVEWFSEIPGSSTPSGPQRASRTGRRPTPGNFRKYNFI